MNFFINWIVSYFLIMFAMSVDNIFWIPTSPEYPQFKKMTKFQKFKYILIKRIFAVLVAWRDIVPALITSFIMTILWRIL